MLRKSRECKLTGHSGWYLTEPVGVKDQEQYVNGVASVSTELSANDLLRMLLAIEQDMGRVRRTRWESRIIDLDLLLYGREVIKEKHLTVPHPLMHLRRFVLVPMVELEPNLTHPSLGLTMSELLAQLPEDGQEVGLTEEQ
jgi:2-amino-4-hydroxy-6-hydroxymethyldihydropteridine diphosphokinase